jgi:hypothetical protein
MEITIATMGRRIKNLDMALFPRRFRWSSVRLGIHSHSRANLLNAFGDYALTRLQSLINNPLSADAVAGLHISNGNLVVAPYHGDLVRTLHLRDGPLRDKQCGTWF